MSIQNDLITFLKTKPSITDLLGIGSTDNPFRFSPTITTHAYDTPYVTYERFTSENHDNMIAASGIANPEFNLNCWGDTLDDAVEVAEALRNVLDGFQGLMDATDVRRAIIEDQSDDFVLDDDGRQEGFYRVIIDLRLWYFRSVPTG